MLNEQVSDKTSLLELTHDAVFAWELTSGAIKYWNKGAEALYGFTAEEALNQSAHQLLTTDFPADLSSIDQSIRRDGRWEGVIEHKTKAGNSIKAECCLVYESALAEENVVLEASRDVTDKTNAEQALAINEQRFRSFVMATAQAVIIADPQGEVVEDSPSWRTFTGQSFEQFRSCGWAEAVHPEDRESFRQLWTQSVMSNTSYEGECRLHRADGQYRWASMHAVPIKNADDSVREWVGAVTDITDKKQAEDVVRTNEERLQYALDAGAMMTWDWNLSTGFAKRTGPAKALLGIADGPAEAFFPLVDPRDQPYLAQALEHAKSGEAPLDLEFRIRPPDGDTIWLSVKGRLREDSASGQQYMTGVAMDTTQRRQIEERLMLLDEIAEATRTTADADALVTQTISRLGAHLGAARCVYAELEHEHHQLVICQEWTSEGVSGCAGIYSLDLLGSSAAADMRNGHTLVVRDAERELTRGDGSEMFESLGIKAAICCRILKGERLLAMIAVHQDVPRDWTAAEVSLVEEVAERSWAHIERVRAREALQKSEAHLSTLLEQTAVGILETDLSGRVIRVNDRYCQILGRNRDAILGGQMKDFTHPDDLPHNLALFQQALKTGKAFEIEKRYLRPDGTIVWVNNTVSFITAAGDKGRSVLAIVVDVTERKQAEAKLVETANQLQFTLESAKIGSWELDLTTDTAKRSPRHDQCLGLTESTAHWGFEEFIQRVHPADRNQVARQFREAVDNLSDWHFECRVVWPDRSVHWIAAHGNIHCVDSKPCKMSGIVFDITDRKGHETALRESEQHAIEAASQAESERRRLNVLLQAVPVSIAMTDVDGKFVELNPAHKRLWGEKHPSLLSAASYKQWKGWWADGSSRNGKRVEPDEWSVARVLRGEHAPHDIVEIESFDTPPVHHIVLCSAAPIKDGGDRITGAVIAQMDITDRVKAEEALREADRRKDEFLAMLAHELRNPLAPIGAAADILRLTQLDEARVKQASAIISRQVKHMTGLVDDLLDVSRVTRGLVGLDKGKLDAKRVVADAVEQIRPLIEARRHQLVVHTPPDSAYVHADQKRLVQVVTNLLNNAAKYTPEGGEIDLSVDVDGDHVRIKVSDNGIGMPPKLVERVFEMFAQAERSSDRTQGGLGIGLALVRSLVELHGGTVHARSEGPGTGSTFTICLPQLRQQADTVSASQNAQSSAAPSRVLKIMVVDDNVDAAQMLAMFCEALGHTALVEHDPRRALERAKAEIPDVCLLDIGLPEMDGNELARHLRAHPATAGATLIAVTGYGQDQDKTAALEAGFDRHFVKPLDTEKLAELLDEVAEVAAV